MGESMSFNIGDKVRLTGPRWPERLRGTDRIVTGFDRGSPTIADVCAGSWHISGDGGYTATLVEPAAPTPLSREQIEAFAKVARAGDTITYRWRGAPGGSEIETTLVSDEDGDLRAASGPVFKAHVNLMTTWGSVYIVTAVHHQPDSAPSAADLPVGTVVGDVVTKRGPSDWGTDSADEFSDKQVQACLDSGEWRVISLPIQEDERG